MKVTVKPINMTEYDIRFERGDELYFNCLWARIILDHDHYTLFAETDCGNYTYGWTPTPKSESFMHLMARIEEEYLLGKVSSETVFLMDKSKEKTIEAIRDGFAYLPKKDLDFICEMLIDIEDVGEEGFVREADRVLARNKIHDTFEIIHVEKDYPTGAKVFARIFHQVVQPEIRRQLKSQSGTGL